MSEPQLIPIFSTGAGAPEEAAAGGGRQVCVGGESVHHGGQLQLLGRGGLAGRSQRPGERRSSLSLAKAPRAVFPFLPPLQQQQLFPRGSLTPAGNLPEALKCLELPVAAVIGRAARWVQVSGESRETKSRMLFLHFGLQASALITSYKARLTAAHCSRCVELAGFATCYDAL